MFTSPTPRLHPRSRAFPACLLALASLATAAQREATPVGTLEPAAHHALVLDLDGQVAGHLASDPAGRVRAYDLATAPEWASATDAPLAEVYRTFAYALPPALSPGEGAGYVLAQLSGRTPDGDFRNHTALLSPGGTVARAYPDTRAEAYVHGGKPFVQLRRWGERESLTLVGAGGDTLWRADGDTTLLDFGRITLGGEARFYAWRQDDLTILDLAGETVATYPSSPPLWRLGSYGSRFATGLLRVDVLDDGIPDFALAVADDRSDEGTNYLAIVDADGDVVYDTVPPGTNERKLFFRTHPEVLTLTTTLPPDSSGRRYYLPLAAYDAGDLRELALLHPGERFSVGTYAGRASLFYCGEDSITLFDPYAARRQVSVPREFALDGEAYRWGGFVNLADTVSGYGDALYTRAADSLGRGGRHVTVTRDLQPVFAFDGGSAAAVGRGVDGAVYARTAGALVNGLRPGSRVYRLLGADGSSSVGEGPGLQTAPLFAPNPARAAITFSSDEAAPRTRVRIYTPSGALVRDYPAVSPGQSLDLALSPGLYLVEVAGPTGERRASRLVVR